MKQSDQTIHRFSIHQIKKHTFQPYVFRWTNFYESNWDFQQLHPGIQMELTEDELLICSTVINAENYSLLTTRRIVTKENGIENPANLEDAIQKTPPLQSKFEKYNYVFGTLELSNKDVFKYFIEAGKAAMVIEYGIKTLLWSQQLTDSQMINLMRLWDKKSKIDP